MECFFLSLIMEIYPIQCLTVQATPFCNLDCTYCYLPNRSNKAKFDVSLIPIIFNNIIESDLVGDSLYWDWHAGEPLVPGLDFYKETTQLIKKHKPKNLQVNIGMQTNATLITDEIAAFFKKNKFRIGVSIDGPEAIQNKNRVYRNKKGSFKDCIRGIELLKKHKVPFHVISVLSEYSLGFPDDMYDFFFNLGTTGVAFNIEEVEGIHSNSSVNNQETGHLFTAFFERFFTLHLEHNEPFQIREWNKFVSYKRINQVNGTTVPFAHLTIDTNGNFSTFSPELITIENHPKHHHFIFGNIKENRILDALQNRHFREIYTEIQAGVKQCKKTCSYFETCGGGMVSNKLFENGTFNSTTTMACRYMEQTLCDIAEKMALDYIQP